MRCRTGSISGLSAQNPHQILQFLLQLVPQFSHQRPLKLNLTPSPPPWESRKIRNPLIARKRLSLSLIMRGKCGESVEKPSYSAAGKGNPARPAKASMPELGENAKSQTFLWCRWPLSYLPPWKYWRFVHLLISCYVHNLTWILISHLYIISRQTGRRSAKYKVALNVTLNLTV